MPKIEVGVSAIGSIAQAITELTKAISKWVGSGSMRRMIKCIRNADLIVKRIEALGIDDKRLDKLMKNHEKLNN